MPIKRRTWLKRSISGAGALFVSGGLNLSAQDRITGLSDVVPSYKYKHSVCRWCYSAVSLEKLIVSCKAIGIHSIELLGPEEYKIVIQNGLDCAIANGSPLGITKGFNESKNHNQLQKDYERLIPIAADHGIGKIICFSGNRNKSTDKKALDTCAKGLDKLVKLAGKYNMQVVMELLNSKVDHKDYHCDHTVWGVALAEKLASPHFKLLYDIYHMQIMEGDVIATIRKYSPYISHYHTGGVPGRNEINDSQELNYKAIIKAIAETGYDGYIGQEFIPTRKDPFESLQEGIRICSLV